MKYPGRTTIASVLLLPFLSSVAPAQGEDMAFDFRVTDSVTTRGRTVAGISTGHAVVSKGRVRIDMKGTSRSMAMPGTAGGGETSIIMSDSGKTLIFLQPKSKQFLLIKPAEMMEGMQKMMEGMGATISVDVDGDEPKVENLGSGPVILGHKTLHYRITIKMKMSVNAMGQSQTMGMESTSEEYLAPDLERLADVFGNMGASGFGSSSMGNMVGPGAKSLGEKMKAMRAKLPKGAELRAETRALMTTAGQTSTTKSFREITAIRKVKASSNLFEVPAGYTKMNMPMIQPGGAPIPPTRS